MKKIIVLIVAGFLLFSVLIPNTAAVSQYPSSIALENKVKEALYYFDPVPTMTAGGTEKTAEDVYIYRMGDIVQGSLDVTPAGSWFVALEELDGTIVDQVSMSGGKAFSIGTGNVSQDGLYKVVATDSLTGSPNWLTSVKIYIKYNIQIENENIVQCPAKTNTVSGTITRGNGQTVLVPVTVSIVYPNNGKLAAQYSISAGSSGQFTLTFPGTTDLWYYDLFVSDSYPSVSPDNDAIIYKKIPNFSNVKWNLRPLVMNPLLYDDTEGVLDQSITLQLTDQDGKPVTGKKDYFYIGLSWTGYTVEEISPGVYKIHGGHLSGGAVAIYVKQAIQSNILTFSLYKLSYFNPYIHISANYAEAPYGGGPYYDYTTGKDTFDKLPPEMGASFEAEIGMYPVPEVPDPANGKYTLKDNYYMYKWNLESFSGIEYHKIGPDDSTVWNDPSTNTITMPVFYVKDSGNISFTVNATIWKRANQDKTAPWGSSVPDPLNACCVIPRDYTFKMYSTNPENCTVAVSPQKVTVGEIDDLKIHVGNVNSVIHVYMLNKDGSKTENAFTVSYKGGREKKILSDLWYNPGHLSGTNISTLPVNFSYDDNIDVKWVGGDVIFKEVSFNSITVCPHCPRIVVVEVFRADGDIHPLCAMIKNAVEVDPVVKELQAEYAVVPKGGTETDTLLAGLNEPIYITVHFTYEDVNWQIFYNGKPLEDYGVLFVVSPDEAGRYVIVFNKPLPFDENYVPNKLSIIGTAIDNTKTKAERIELSINSVNPPADNEPPTIQIVSPTEGVLINKKIVEIKGKVSDNVAVSKLLVFNSESEFTEKGEFDVTVSLKEGENEVPVEVVDAAGNKTDKVLTIFVDTIPPELLLNTLSKETTSSEITISGTTEQGAIVSVNGKIVGTDNGKFSLDIGLVIGENDLEVVAVDKAGNRTEKRVTITRKKKVVIILQPDNPMMTVNGIQQEIDPGRGTKPVIIPKWGRTIVPIRAIVEALGGAIEWDGTERKVTIQLDNKEITLWIDNPIADVDGAEVYIDENNHEVKPIIVNDRTMLPLRFVAESLGCKVDWDSVTRTITIIYAP